MSRPEPSSRFHFARARPWAAWQIHWCSDVPLYPDRLDAALRHAAAISQHGSGRLLLVGDPALVVDWQCLADRQRRAVRPPRRGAAARSHLRPTGCGEDWHQLRDRLADAEHAPASACEPGRPLRR